LRFHFRKNDSRPSFFLGGMKLEPLPISVLIPAYNRADRLGRALASVAAQLRPPAEVIVVDDGSDDDTAGEAERGGAVVVRHEVNRGCAIARNSGLGVATQPWVAMLDSDDEWLPGHLASLWPLRGDHLVLANSALECGEGARRDRLIGLPGNRPLVLRSPPSLIHPGNPIPNSAALIRRDAVEAAGGFRPPRVDDLDLWLRLLENGTGLVSPVVGAIYYLHPAQISGAGDANQRMHETVARRFEDRPWWSPAHLERWRGKAAWNNLRSALRSRQPGRALRSGALLASNPQRTYGALSAGILRMRLRRRCAGLRDRVKSQRIPPDATQALAAQGPPDA
jgi:glycosyltransferase involved in cell wall biosynthesis